MEPLDPYGVLDLVPEGIVVADGEGRVTHASTRAARLLGCAVEDLVGCRIDDALPLQNEHGRDWLACHRPYDGLPTRTDLVEQSALLPDGTELLVTARIHRDAERRVQQLVVSLRGARQRARLDHERSDLVASIAHELRSPLTGVKGFVATLITKWDRLNDQQKLLMLTTVHSDSERLARLIAELLDVARIDTGRLSLYPREVDLVAATERVLGSVGQSTSRTLSLEVDPGLPDVHFDPDKLVQVLTNLVENAVRHGDGVVTVRLEPVQAAEEWPGVRVRVDDEGDGIDHSIRSRVFTKFWTSGIRGGSGLGLYIVHGLTRAHGGTVQIDDAPGGGARVELVLPTEDRRGL